MQPISELAEAIRENDLCQWLLTEEPLAPRTTLRIGGKAALLAIPKNAAAVADLRALAAAFELPSLLLGNGSNLLVSDEGFPGLVISLRETVTRVQCDGECITAGAGLSLSQLAAFARDQGLAGLEFAAGIPGTVGGGLYMNCGAYGGEMKDVVESSMVLEPEGGISVLRAGQHGFAYRHSALMENGDIVLAATFRLQKDDPQAIGARMEELARRRREKQPLHLPSAGSTFKRPAEGYAAQMIDECGLKGLRVGGAVVSEKHAGFLCNDGGATAADFLALMDQVQRRVQERFGVRLAPEVRYVGIETELSHVVYS
ncbi:MAG: UDP-N-acetylmuramate dehydrogenase [Clostridia bacterium]|nr:UDP-N-acetylmuramate dehydrogenase [Clostridia bacterium]